jgi:hypothetical protein
MYIQNKIMLFNLSLLPRRVHPILGIHIHFPYFENINSLENLRNMLHLGWKMLPGILQPSYFGMLQAL